jgi:2-hydroxychromene-2-carboxylate isomerase
MSGEHADHPGRFASLCRELSIDPIRLADPGVKDALRRNTEEAAERGVFGVPSLVIDGEVFWGADAIDFARTFIADPAALRNAEMERVDSLPVGATRKP